MKTMILPLSGSNQIIDVVASDIRVTVKRRKEPSLSSDNSSPRLKYGVKLKNLILREMSVVYPEKIMLLRKQNLYFLSNRIIS